MRKIHIHKFLDFFLLGVLSIGSFEVALAQIPSPPATDSAVQAQADKGVDPQPAAATVDPGAKEPRGSIVIAPLPIVSPAIGAGIIPVFGYIFPFQKKDKISPPSVAGVAGLLTDNGTHAIVLMSDFFMKQNRYELRPFYFHGALNYDLYGEGYEAGTSNLRLPLEQEGQLFSVYFLRNIHWNIFAGPHFVTGNSTITVKPTSGETPPAPQDVGLKTNLTALGLEVLRDSRPNRFYPEKGSLIDFTVDFYSKDLGSKYSYESYHFTFNKYWSVGKKQVLAYNLFGCGTGGNAPFYGKCVYGTSNQLRGYTAGRYLDEYMFATQVEYRVGLPWRLGLAGFGGIGGVAPEASKFRSKQFLPAGGTGIRFLLNKKFNVNLRTDFAWGKDNFTWSMGVGEAF
jgi:hypothetical protein